MDTIIRFNTFCIFFLLFIYIFYKLHQSILKGNINSSCNCIKLSFFLSILFITLLTLFPTFTYMPPNIQFNIKPFNTIKSILSEKDILYMLFNLLGNLILFVPIGFFSYLKFNYKLLKSILFCTSTTVLVEILQLFIPSRLTDIDDCIINLIGVLIGIFLAKIYLTYINKLNLPQKHF